MRNRWWINVLWLVLPLVPVALNFIIVKGTGGWAVAGNEASWVSFWGSYAGGCVTSVISYIILKRTIDYYKSENASRIYESHKERLRADVSSRLAGLNTKRFMLLYIRLAQGEAATSICQILDATSIEIENNLSSFKILYMGQFDNFISEYERLAHKVQRAINDTAIDIRDIPDKDVSSARRNMVVNSKRYFEYLEGMQKEVDGFWAKAAEMIR